MLNDVDLRDPRILEYWTIYYQHNGIKAVIEIDDENNVIGIFVNGRMLEVKDNQLVAMLTPLGITPDGWTLSPVT